MKFLVLSDMHGNWLESFWSTLDFISDEISKWNIHWILSLWDNYKEDLRIFKDLDIPKLAVHWNNDLIKKWNDDWLEDYWFTNLHLKTVKIKWITFWWIEWSTWLLLSEWLKNNNGKLSSFATELNLIKSNLNTADVIISHFPIYSIHDDIESFSHRWLKAALDLLDESTKLKYYLHWHLHNPEETMIWKTLVKEVYWSEIVDIKV